MKKTMFKTLIMGIMVFSLASCSDDNNDPTINFPEGTVNSLTTGYEEGEFTIPVLATGDWKATVVSEDAYWLSLITTEGKGNGNVTYLVEPNASDEYRKAQIVLTAGKQTLTYEVTQTTLSTSGDEEAQNGAEIDYSMFGSSVPVGYGMYIKGKSNMKKFAASQIFSLKNLSNERLEDYLYDDYVEVEDVPTDKIKLASAKEFKEQDRSIKANLSVNIQYGMFKLGLNGAFKMSGASTDTTFVYSAVTSVPRQEVFLQHNALLDAYEEIPSELKAYVMTNSFVKIRDSIQTLVKANKTLEDNELKKQLKKLNDNYGPVFCTNATLGGNANISITLGKAEGTDTLDISGKLTTAFSGLFSLDVEASASYLNQASSYIENSEIDIDITGGSKGERTNLIKAFGEIVKPGADTSAMNSALIDNISTWAATIDPADSKTYTCTEYALTGIWELFTDEDAQQIVKDYMASIYPNQKDEKGNVVLPYLVDIQTMVNE